MSIVAVTDCDCSGDQDTTTYDSKYILPASAPFAVDTAVFRVDIALDRTVSTPGGLRLYAKARVTYDHAMPVQASSPVVGIDLDWPDFLSLVTPPGMRGCDMIEDDVCYLTELNDVGDVQEVELWFDMPEAGGVTGQIRALRPRSATTMGKGAPNCRRRWMCRMPRSSPSSSRRSRWTCPSTGTQGGLRDSR